MAVPRGKLLSMAELSGKKTKTITIADLFPDLSENQLKEVRETLDRYCELLFQIFERLERERRNTFDDGLPGL